MKEKFTNLIGKIKKIDINKNRALFWIPPLIVILVMLICGTCYSLNKTKYQYFANIGIDFQGGSILTIEFKDSQANLGAKYDENVNKIYNVLEKHGIPTNKARNQSSGDSTIIIQYPNWVSGTGSATSDAKAMDETNTQIKEELYAMANAGTFDEIADNGVTFSVIGSESSKNLLKTAAISVAIALVLMLLYIVIRFDFYSGLAAVLIQLHDLIIMFALSVIFYIEIGDSIVAGLITIVGYSINNTIVVFDRIRSVIKPLKKQGKKYDEGLVINNAIFSTMRRTLFTTFTTLIVMIVLVAMGVASIVTFGLPIIFGLIAGFYSSVFLAAPLWGALKDLGDKIKLSTKNKKFAKQHKRARA